MPARTLETTPLNATPPSPIGPRPRSRRGTFLKWLRKVHGWVGLWGAVVGLLFGVTGILQDHRATMKIHVGGPRVSKIQVPVPHPPPDSPQALATFLQTELKLERAANRINREAEQPVNWGGRSMMLPEHWTVRFSAPNGAVSADLWKGGTLINVERREQGLLGMLEGLHRVDGAQVGWILFADSIGGSLILLSITGVLLWTELTRRKTIGASILIASLIAAVVLAAQSM